MENFKEALTVIDIYFLVWKKGGKWGMKNREERMQIIRERYPRAVKLCGKEIAQEILFGYFRNKMRFDEQVKFAAEITACNHYH